MNNNTDPNYQSEYSPWNPFLPTKRDIERSEELSKKEPWVAGVLSFLLLPAAMIYLNRGVNNLKIVGYVFVIAFAVGLTTYNSKNEKELDAIGNLIGVCGQIAATAENIRAVTLARKRVS
ncbi:hypothetical protein DSM106972_015240 [Dulcicalothrix desertica PCC 7102]|uniref:Uncharacterized protein n=1 Tax=Dulcicalothrix desertica PCC 7102 TaxID=232991 RepID=A0A3S1DE71_9CYAN|nr:hypothetical protein [Dulcicalothrix desertica]RUT08356.1 hypothetical protein DSM106972_015240 [Dulcicalothrix desertica PCC 7102]TWH40222.1 hypothetical protein CAL7102_09526 [Dulcicalothrix desertica PCC 7102]